MGTYTRLSWHGTGEKGNKENMKERDIFFDPLKTEEDMIHESFERLRFAAKCKEKKLGLSNCEYTWEIGAEVIDKVYKNVIVNREKYTLFG